MRPLEGIRVLDLTRVLAGPYCTWILGALGADVVKVEQPGVGDQSRGYGPYVAGESVYFMSINRCKRGITLDLKRGADVVRRLIERSDVLVENFSPGVMERTGLSYAAVSAINRRLVYASISGFGQTGPAASKRAYDPIVQALSGLMSVTGEPGQAPVRVGFSIGDIAAGTFSAVAILAALRQRDATGRGQWLDVGMVDSLVAMMEYPVARYATAGELPTPLGNRHPTITPEQAFLASDGWFVLAVANEKQWRSFCAVIDRPELASDLRYQTNGDRTRRHDELETLLASILVQRTRREWIERLGEAGIPAAALHNVADLVEWDQVRARSLVAEVVHPVAGRTRLASLPFRSSEADSFANSPAPTLGAQTDTVLAELGYTASDVAAMRADNII